MVWGALIGAAASLAGGALSSQSQGNAASQAADAAANNIAMQREFAQTGITWRARDAIRASQETGIHPLSLIGVNPASFSPVAQTFVPQTGWGEGLAAAGQNIQRAIASTQDRDLRERALALQEIAMNSSVEQGMLQNELLRVNIDAARMRLAQSQMPGVPAMKPEGSIMFPGVEPNVIPDVSVARTPRGGYVVLPSKAAQERMEEMFGLGPEWFARNRAWLATPEARAWVQRYLPAPPPYMEWNYNIPTGEWLPQYRNYPDRHLPNTDAQRRVDYLRRHGAW